METYQIWKSKEIKNTFIKILGQNPDGTIAVSFAVSHFVPAPMHVHNYQPWYLEQFYENTGEAQNWVVDSKLMKLENATA